MPKVVLFGGGEIKHGETKKIDQFVLDRAKGKESKVLFIPGASDMNEEYILKFKRYFKGLGCNVVDHLDVRNKDVSELKEHMLKYDIIYLGGGDPLTLKDHLETSNAMDIFNDSQFENKFVLGMSAGAMILGERFHNQRGVFTEHLFYDGMDIFPGVCFEPHFTKDRLTHIIENLKSPHITKGVGLAENAAVFFENGKGKVLSGDIFMYTKDGKKIKKTVFKEGDEIEL